MAFFKEIYASNGAFKFYIDGKLKEFDSGKTVDIINPFTLQKQFKIQACTPEEVNKCVDQAKKAQKSWAKVPLWKRAQMLHTFAKILREQKDPIARCLTDEVGKCLKDAVVEGCIFTKNIDNAIMMSDAMESGTIQINAAPARGPDHFPFQGLRDSGIGSQGITNTITLMTKTKSTVINFQKETYTMG